MTKIFFYVFFYCKRNKRYAILYPFNYFVYRLILSYYGGFISLKTKLNGKLILPHGLHGVFISQDAEIGKNVTVFHQVTIGSIQTMDSKHPGAPIIGDNVIIGAGAKIIGGISIGNNVRIGANSVVVKDTPDNSVVIGVPGRIVKQ